MSKALELSFDKTYKFHRYIFRLSSSLNCSHWQISRFGESKWGGGRQSLLNNELQILFDKFLRAIYLRTGEKFNTTIINFDGNTLFIISFMFVCVCVYRYISVSWDFWRRRTFTRGKSCDFYDRKHGRIRAAHFIQLWYRHTFFNSRVQSECEKSPRFDENENKMCKAAIFLVYTPENSVFVRYRDFRGLADCFSGSEVRVEVQNWKHWNPKFSLFENENNS